MIVNTNSNGCDITLFHFECQEKKCSLQNILELIRWLQRSRISSIACLLGYSPLRKIQSIFLLATSVFSDTMRRDRQILSRRESERYTSVVQVA